MLDTIIPTLFDYPLVCHAEVDLPAWLASLTSTAGWKLWREENEDNCDLYLFRNQASEAHVAVYHSGYARIEVDGEVLYDDTLSAAGDFASIHYFNAENGRRVLLN
jgi:hypothetical protein